MLNLNKVGRPLCKVEKGKYNGYIVSVSDQMGSNEDEDKEESKKRNIPKILLITFLVSFVLLNIGKYGIEYMNTKKFFQKGGVDVVEHLTIVADDLDYNIMES